MKPPTLQRHAFSRARRSLRSLVILAVALSLTQCTRDESTAPLVRTAPPRSEAAIVTSLGTLTIGVPTPQQLSTPSYSPRSGTWPTDGAQYFTNGITVPANTAFRIRVHGTVTLVKAPTVHWADTSMFSLLGSYGPGGAGSSQLLVQVSAYWGSNRYDLSFPTSQQSGDTAISQIYYYDHAVTVYAGRTGVWGGRASMITGGQPVVYDTLYQLIPAQTAEVEQLSGVVQMTADPVRFKVGQQVKFTMIRDDGSNQITNWWWQTDDGHSAAFTLCGQSNPCVYAPPAKGWTTVWTDIGYAQMYLTPYSGLALDAAPATVYYGDTVTFTPKYDGVAGPAARWRWVPSDTSNHDAVACANGVSPCKKRIVGAGRMWVYTATSGGDSASALVTVLDKFELRAAPSLVQAGGVVTFRPYLNGQPAPSARWRWNPQDASAAWDSVAGCANNVTECHRATFVHGVMWAFRLTSGGDSASAEVWIAGETCGGSFAKRPSRSLAKTTPTVASQRTGAMAPRRSSTTMPPTCGDTAATSSDAGTGSLPSVLLHVAVPTPGIDASPVTGDLSYPLGTVVPYQFLPKAGYDSPVVFVDDTLRVLGGTFATSGTVVMSTEHTIRAATDTNFALRPGIAALRTRLEALIHSSDQPLAFARYLLWGVDSVTNPKIDDEIALAEYLQFDPVADSVSIAQFDDAIANYSFQIDGVGGGQHAITILSPGDSVDPRVISGGQIVANRSPGRNTRRVAGGASASTASNNGVAFVFVNGIRTVESGAMATQKLLALRLSIDSFPNSTVDYYWNRNLRGVITKAASDYGGCGLRAVRDGAFRNYFVAMGRYIKCHGVPIGAYFIPDDLGESLNQFLRQQWNIPIGPASQDAHRLADRMAWYHQHSYHTVMLTHSQGNMVYNDATSILPSLEGGPVNTVACTAAMSLAAPLNREDFHVNGVFLDGIDVNGDLLLILGLPNNFQKFDSQQTLERNVVRSALPEKFSVPVTYFYGPRIHEVDNNYFKGILSDTTYSRIRGLYNTCMNR